jgi:hypothetical protein
MGKKDNDDESEFREETPAERRAREMRENEDARHIKDDLEKAHKYIINQLDSAAPNDNMIGISAAKIASAFGSAGFFQSDPHSKYKECQQAISTAMERNKDRDGARGSVHILARRLQELIHAENDRDHKLHERSERFRNSNDNKKGGNGFGRTA